MLPDGQPVTGVDANLIAVFRSPIPDFFFMKHQRKGFKTEGPGDKALRRLLIRSRGAGYRDLHVQRLPGIQSYSGYSFLMLL